MKSFRYQRSKSALVGIGALMLALLIGFSSGTEAAGARTNYLLYCSGCHLVDGGGSPPNVPTLHHELGRMMDVPAMRSYLLRVPGAAHTPLKDADLAAVINWVLEEFNAETLPENFEPISAAEAGAARQEVLANPVEYRARHWKPYQPDEFSPH